MSDNSSLIQTRLLRDMSEGLMTIGMNGRIESVNPAAAAILDRSEEELVGKAFARCFFEYEENDAFNQAILDAVYSSGESHRNYVPYYTGERLKQLHMTTSYLRDGDRRVAVIAVISDITELEGLRDAVRAMEQIRELNNQLELRNQLLQSTFGRFLSDDIVRQLLETPDGLALGGKKRELTVLMSDLRGFTALSERMDAQDLLTMLNHYLGEMTRIIQSRSGTIIEFIGDGIMAVFGAPTESPVHASDCVAAAVEMEARMEAVNAWNAERGYPELEMGIGITTGEVIVGNIGSEQRTKYGVTGSQVNLCGRIESYTVGGQILISPATRAAIGDAADIEAEMEVMPKGVKEPILISHVVGMGAPYYVSCRTELPDPVPLAEPVAVSFRRITDKHTGAEAETGRIVAACAAGGWLETASDLKDFDNLQMDLRGEEVYCKVLREVPGPGLRTIRFTTHPSQPLT